MKNIKAIEIGSDMKFFLTRQVLPPLLLGLSSCQSGKEKADPVIENAIEQNEIFLKTKLWFSESVERTCEGAVDNKLWVHADQVFGRCRYTTYQNIPSDWQISFQGFPFALKKIQFNFAQDQLEAASRLNLYEENYFLFSDLLGDCHLSYSEKIWLIGKVQHVKSAGILTCQELSFEASTLEFQAMREGIYQLIR